MGQDDDLSASLAHIVLCCVAGRGISNLSGRSYVHPGMHANFFIHGVVGLLHYQSGTFNNDFGPIYKISYAASRYLALPCLMADLYSSNRELSIIHFLSGAIPFALVLAGNENPHLGNLAIACNVISLIFYSVDRNREFGYYTAAAAIFTYFGTPRMPKIVYPLGLAVMEYLAYRLHSGAADTGLAPPPGPPGRRR